MISVDASMRSRPNHDLTGINSYLAMGALIAGIVAMYVERTRPSKRLGPKRDSESLYKAGYED